MAATIRDVLVATARAAGTLTYDELLAQLPDGDREAASGNLAPLLRSISIEEDEEERGLLTALVVNERDGLPGVGWFRLASDRGRNVSDRMRAWREEVERVHDAWAD